MEIDRLRETACNPAFASGPYAPQPHPTEVKKPFMSGPDAPLAQGPDAFNP